MLEIEIASTGNEKFLDYVLKKASFGAFVLPNFGQKGSGGKIKQNKVYREYLSTCKPIIDLMENHLIDHYVSNKFMWAKYSHALDIYVFKMNKAFRLTAKNKGPLSNWVFPDLPEDLCLYDKDGTCSLACQSHEDICRVFFESAEDIRLFQSWGVAFERYEHNETYYI